MNPIGQIPAAGGLVNAALNGGIGGANGMGGGAANQARFDQLLQEAGYVGMSILMPFINKAIQRPDHGG